MLIEILKLSAKVSKLYYKHEIILYSFSNKWLIKMYILMIHTNRSMLESKMSVKTRDYWTLCSYREIIWNESFDDNFPQLVSYWLPADLTPCNLTYFGDIMLKILHCTYHSYIVSNSLGAKILVESIITTNMLYMNPSSDYRIDVTSD